ncbi:MAG: DUF998 domain-containing protein [Rhodanobacteraceae bacterium]
MDASPQSDPAESIRRGDAARDEPLVRALGIIALIGVAMISVVCLLVQFLRTDLDWITTSMSLYVAGPYGDWVQASFFAPVPGIAALGIGWYRSLDRNARSVIPLVLFVVAAVALCVLASFTADATQQPVTLHGLIHQWATFGTFVCITTAMLVQSWLMHRDPRCRGRCSAALTIAAIAVVYFWIYALVKPIPRGLGEKVVIGLVLLWLWRASWWLVRGRRS